MESPRSADACPVQIVVDDIAPIRILHLQKRHPALDRRVRDGDVDLAVVPFDSVGDLAQRRCRGCRPLCLRFFDQDHPNRSSAGVADTAFEAGETGPAMSMATTLAPLAAISSAMARPMPLAAPVTTATLPREPL
jgi:hypothetical protein